MNVIRFPDQNTLNIKVKKIKNPQKETSEGFFYCSVCPIIIKFDLKPKRAISKIL